MAKKHDRVAIQCGACPATFLGTARNALRLCPECLVKRRRQIQHEQYVARTRGKVKQRWAPVPQTERPDAVGGHASFGETYREPAA